MQRRTKSQAELDAAIAKGNEAALLLSHPTLTGILEQMETEATQKMVESAKLEDRETAWHKVQAVRAFKQELSTISTSGRIAKAAKDQLKGNE
ncbi:hypothetical protein P0D69_28140 [Paraburkholderia sediminicola]|uniref:hypothetical protein n=1 Tax=Paraburkholderia sediminicola TaxID=458836 RepID=UPI0038BB50EC